MTSPPIRVETVRVRNAGRRPLVIAILAAVVVAVSIMKPWARPDDVRPARLPAASSAASGPSPSSGSPPAAAASVQEPAGLQAAKPGHLTPGQIACGSADWRIVTLGGFTRWTVRTWIAIEPVAASGPADPAIPVLSLGRSDIAGLGACASSGGVAAPGRASRIIAAWLRSTAAGSTASLGPVALADLDALPSGGPASSRLRPPRSVAELVRPVASAPGGRWPAGQYALRLASPDASPDRWIVVEIGDNVE